MRVRGRQGHRKSIRRSKNDASRLVSAFGGKQETFRVGGQVLPLLTVTLCRLSHHCPLQAPSVLYTHLMTVLYGAWPPSTIVCVSSVFLEERRHFLITTFRHRSQRVTPSRQTRTQGRQLFASLCVFGDKRRQQVSVRRLRVAARELEEFVDGRRSKEEVVTKSNQAGGEPVQSHGLGETKHWCQHRQHISK